MSMLFWLLQVFKISMQSRSWSWNTRSWSWSCGLLVLVFVLALLVLVLVVGLGLCLGTVGLGLGLGVAGLRIGLVLDQHGLDAISESIDGYTQGAEGVCSRMYTNCLQICKNKTLYKFVCNINYQKFCFLLKVYRVCSHVTEYNSCNATI